MKVTCFCLKNQASKVGFVFVVVLELLRAVGSRVRKCRMLGVCLCLLRKRRASSLAREKRTKEKQRVDRARPSFAVLCRPMASQMRRSAIDNHVIGVVALACVRAEASSLARFCWQRVEQRERRANEIIYFLFVFVMWWRAVDGVCALLGAVCAARCCVCGWVLCARLNAVCALFTQCFFASL